MAKAAAIAAVPPAHPADEASRTPMSSPATTLMDLQHHQQNAVVSSSTRRRGAAAESCLNPTKDGYCWRKYGQKQVKGSEHPRSYYRCTAPDCPVRKKVEFSGGEETCIYTGGVHNHESPSTHAQDRVLPGAIKRQYSPRTVIDRHPSVSASVSASGSALSSPTSATGHLRQQVNPKPQTCNSQS